MSACPGPLVSGGLTGRRSDRMLPRRVGGSKVRRLGLLNRDASFVRWSGWRSECVGVGVRVGEERAGARGSLRQSGRTGAPGERAARSAALSQ